MAPVVQASPPAVVAAVAPPVVVAGGGQAVATLPAAVGTPGNRFISPSLYVGDLDPNVTEAQLYEIFNQVGQVVSVRVCRDLVSRRSLGYAYINYNNAQEASRALELLNFSSVNGKLMRIMYSYRDPSLRRSGTANIFIKNLEKGIDNKALFDTFSVFGPILSCKVATDSNGQSRGYGYVQFEHEDSAQTAIEKVNGMLINEKQVYVGVFQRRQERDMANAWSKFNNVYVKNLSESVTDEDLKTEFGQFGPISSAVVMRDAEGKSKCFGFVNFEDPDDAVRAVENLNGKKVNDKEWYVGRAQKKSEREAELRSKFEVSQKERSEKPQAVNLYLKNLDDEVEDGKLREMFSVYGPITSCKVMKDQYGHSKGSGFVSFFSAEDANRALNEMNGKMVGTKPLYVAIAQRKEERHARLQAQFSQMRNGVVPSPALVQNTPPPVYHPGGPGIGQPVFYGQPPPPLITPQGARFGYQQPMVQGIRPGGAPMPNYFMPIVQRPVQQAQQVGGRRGGGMGPFNAQPVPPPQQMLPRGAMRGFRYTESARNTSSSDPSLQGLGGISMNTSEMMGKPRTALASSMASAPPEQQRVMLGENLYPLVEQLEHERAGKITGMLLELDQSEVLHLIESPDDLKAKVAEAVEVLRLAQSAQPAIDQLQALSLAD